LQIVLFANSYNPIEEVMGGSSGSNENDELTRVNCDESERTAG